MTKKAPAKSHKPKKTAAAPATPDPAGSEADFDHFLPRARALAAKDVHEFHLSPVLAGHNLAPGVAAVLAEKARISSELPQVDLARLEELPALASAVSYAASLVDRHSDGTVADLLGIGRALRRKLADAVAPLANEGIFSAAELSKLHPGSGVGKLGGHLTALAALFRSHAADTRGKTTIAAADVENAAKVGKQLSETIKPRGTKKTPAADLQAAIDTRDRLGTLLLAGHEQLWSVGAYLFGFAVEEKVPFLGAHAGRVKHRATKTPPTTPTKGS